MRELFSRRQARARGELSDVFIYDAVPEAFRNQFNHILDNIFNTLDRHSSPQDTESLVHEHINKELAMRFGKRKLLHYSCGSAPSELKEFIRESSDSDCIDAIDHILHFCTLLINVVRFSNDEQQCLKEAITDTNYWLKCNNLGFEFVNDSLITIANNVIHKEVTLPAFELLSDPKFAGANAEMRQAYEHRRTGANQAAIVEANKAFESVLKIICDIKQYAYDATWPAKKLLDTLSSNNYYPPYLDCHLRGLKSTLESGLPTVRNKNAGHGQGAQVAPVPDAYVDYALHLLSTNIVFLITLL